MNNRSGPLVCGVFSLGPRDLRAYSTVRRNIVESAVDLWTFIPEWRSHVARHQQMETGAFLVAD